MERLQSQIAANRRLSHDQPGPVQLSTFDAEELLEVVEAAQELADNESEYVVGRRLREALAVVHTPDSAEEQK